jgi:hypothetical protein
VTITLGLGTLAPVIVDLITIYDSDPVGIDTAVLVVNETMSKI